MTLCRGYMRNKIISKLFQKLIAAHKIFSNMFNVASWNNFEFLFQCFILHATWNEIISAAE